MTITPFEISPFCITFFKSNLHPNVICFVRERMLNYMGFPKENTNRHKFSSTLASEFVVETKQQFLPINVSGKLQPHEDPCKDLPICT